MTESVSDLLNNKNIIQFYSVRIIDYLIIILNQFFGQKTMRAIRIRVVCLLVSFSPINTSYRWQQKWVWYSNTKRLQQQRKNKAKKHFRLDYIIQI